MRGLRCFRTRKCHTDIPKWSTYDDLSVCEVLEKATTISALRPVAMRYGAVLISTYTRYHPFSAVCTMSFGYWAPNFETAKQRPSERPRIPWAWHLSAELTPRPYSRRCERPHRRAARCTSGWTPSSLPPRASTCLPSVSYLGALRGRSSCGERHLLAVLRGRPTGVCRMVIFNNRHPTTNREFYT